MDGPPAWYRIQETLSERLPSLSTAQVAGLSGWVWGALSADSACETAVTGAWQTEGHDEQTIRAYLRETLADGADKAAPCATQLDVGAAMPELMAWLMDVWTDPHRVVLAVDATNRRADRAMLVVSVLYRGTAIPVAWQAMSTEPRVGDTLAADWAGALVTALRRVRPAIPPRLLVLVLADAGLASPRLRKAIRRLGMRPLLRLTKATFVQPEGTSAWVVATSLVRETGQGWAGRALVHKTPKARTRATIVVVWAPGQSEPWVLLTDLRPRQVQASWYALRMWIELGFRTLKRVGFGWQKTRRTALERIERHWLLLGVLMLWTVAVGTRVEDAEDAGQSPTTLRGPRAAVRAVAAPRVHSVATRGRAFLRRQVAKGRFWTRLWLTPESWPALDPRITVHIHDPSLRFPPP